MTRKYREEDVIAALTDLIGRPDVMDRRGDQTAVDIVGSLIELVYRSLNSDIDSVYSLINLHVARQIKLCTEVISYLSEVYELSPTAASRDITFDTAGLTSITQDLIRASFGTGAQQDELLSSVSNKIESYISGPEGTNRTPQHARKRGLDLLIKASGILELIREAALNFPDIIDNYMDAPFEDVMKQRQLERSTAVSESLAANTDDPHQAKLSLAVVSSMLTSRSQGKRDVRSPKFEGGVTLLPGNKASLEGATLPFIIQSSLISGDMDGNVTFQNDEGGAVETGTIEAAVSGLPSLKVNLSGGLFKRTDTGKLHVADPSAIEAAGPLIISSHDDVTGTGEYFSSLSHTSTVSGESTNSALFCPFLKTYVIPGSVKISLRLAVDLDIVGTSPPIPYADIDPEQDTSFINIQMSDDGSGSLVAAVDGGEYDFGKIDYSTGAVLIQTPLDVDLSTDVIITYDYNPFYECRSYVAESGSNTDAGTFFDWGDLLVWENNQVSTTSLSSIGSVEDIVKGESSLSITSSGNVLTFEGNRGGSHSRLTFPYGNSLAYNTEPFAPVWTATPTNLNEALSLTADLYSEAYGADTFIGGVTNSFDKLSLTFNRGPTLSGITFNITDGIPSLLYTNTDLSSVQVGDDVEFSSPRPFHTKVTDVLYRESSYIIQVHPEVPLNLSGTSVGLEPTLTLQGKITRNRINVTSESEDPVTILSVTEPGLGFSGQSQASTTKFSLTDRLNITDVVTSPGYNIKPGDAVVRTDGDITKPIGTVRSIDGNTVTISPTEFGYEYPYSDVEIYSLGWTRFRTIAPRVGIVGGEISDKVENSDLLIKGASYLNSGSGQNTFYQALLTLRDNIGELRNLYLDYDANVVNTANSLLTYFKEDKVSVVSDLLNRCRFDEIALMTPANMSSQSSVEFLLEEIVDVFGANVTSYTLTEGESLLNDYRADFSDHDLTLSRSDTSGDAD